MRITLLAYGTRGDVQPFIALGLGLQRAGHTVRLAAPGVFADFVGSYGLDVAPLTGNPAALSRLLVDRAGHNPLITMQVMYEYVVPIALRVLDEVRAACRDADLIAHSFLLTQAGYEIARERGVPDLSVQTFPVFKPTVAFAGVVAPPLPFGGPLSAAYNRLTHQFTTAMFWYGSLFAYNWLRRKHPDLAPLAGWPFDAADRQPPVLYAISPQVMPPASDWGPDVHVTGYWHLPPASEWTPPESLARYLADGPPPVYIGFGSAVMADAERLTMLAIEALARAGQRGIVAAGWGGMGAIDLPETVYRLADAPHDWLFPQMAAVVHHGGAGTTAAGLRAGVPTVVVAFDADQPFWGRRVRDLGVGPAPIMRQQLTVEKLAYAIRVAATHGPMRQRAAALGERIRAEDGVGTAVPLIEKYLDEFPKDNFPWR